MNCAVINKKLVEYLDGGLSPEERSAVESHLLVCPVCRRELDSFRELNDLIDQTDDPFEVPDMTRAIMSSVLDPEPSPGDTASPEHERSAGFLWLNRRFRSLAADLAAAAAAAMLILWFSSTTFSSGDTVKWGGYSNEVERISGSIGSVVETYVKFSASAVDKLSVFVRALDQTKWKGDAE